MLNVIAFIKEMEEKKSTSMMDEDGLQKADIDEMNSMSLKILLSNYFSSST